MPASNDSPKQPDRFRLDDKVALITGACGILGSGYCSAFVEAGATVIVADLDPIASGKLCEQLNIMRAGSARPIPLDLSQEESVKDLAGSISAIYGRIDVIVNNAAAKSPNFFAPLASFPKSDWDQVMGVNVTGMFLVARELGPLMVRRGRGSIINVSSVYGVVAPDQRIYEGSYYDKFGGKINTPLVYSVSKGAVIALSRYLATYWGPFGVRSNTLTPGGVQSGQNNTFVEQYCARVPLARMATIEDMVGAALFLASDASSYVNGHNLVVDGGFTAW